MISACVIQGNLRCDIDIIIRHFLSQFDYVILSTWTSDVSSSILSDKLVVVESTLPDEPGFSNRNYQRFSTSVGIKKARELNCDYILKWRSDMLPINFDIKQFLKLSNTNIPFGMTSRIVSCAFRNLTVDPDWFSSIPDFFAFGHIDMMELLWGDENFDFSLKYNTPKELKNSLDWERFSNNIVTNYCAETELYAIFKDRIQKKTKKNLSHNEIIKTYFSLINHKELSIIWFGPYGTFRPIVSIYFPWWKVETWNGQKKVKVIKAGYPTSLCWRFLSKYVFLVLAKIDSFKQSYFFNNYKKSIK